MRQEVQTRSVRVDPRVCAAFALAGKLRLTGVWHPALACGPAALYPMAMSDSKPNEPAAAQKVTSLRSLVWDVLLAVLVSAFIIFFLYQPVRVEGTSMLPNLEDQDRLIINKMAFRIGDIHRGDVVVFRYPRDHRTSYIKRVVALPGDRLRIDHGRLIVNGTFVAEPYVPLRFADDRSQPEMQLPPNQYFVMGDHRSISQDSREFGSVDRDLIYGKAAFVYWPVEQAGVVH